MRKRGSTKTRSTEDIERRKSTAGIGVAFSACRITAFAVSEPGPDGEEEGLDITTRIEFAGDVEAERVTVVLVATARAGHAGFSITTTNDFRVSGLSKLDLGRDGVPIVPAWIVETAVTVAVGTTRGVLLAKLHGTAFEGFLLPITGLGESLPPPMRDGVPSHGI